MKTILIGAAVVWCIGFAVIAGMSIRKARRRRKADQIRRLLQCCEDAEARTASRWV